MSVVIGMLEKMGSSASFGRVPLELLDTAEGDSLAPAERLALRGRDPIALNRLLDGRSTMFCMIATPDGAEERNVPDEAEEVPDDQEREED